MTYKGRYEAEVDGAFVVFVIGMRINHFWKPWRWLPTLLAMGPMLSELYQHPEKGFLSAEFMLGARGPVLLQYWRSAGHLERFARSKDDLHLPAWARFNRTVSRDGSTGIFHETYQVPAGAYETIYANMPRHGLAKAGRHLPVGGGKHTSRPASKPARALFPGD